MAQKNPRDISSINTVIIHCSASPNGRPNTAADIEAWHKERGEFFRSVKFIALHQPQFKHIAYHWVIELDGNLVPGRHWREIGAHAYGHNTNSIGVLMVGTDQFSMAQFLTLRALVKSAKYTFPINSIFGHRDVNPRKTCPGFDVSEWLANDMAVPFKHLLKPL